VSRRASRLTGRRMGTTGRCVCGMRPGSFLGCCGAEGRETFFFKTRWLLVYSNIRPARSQHTHALRLTSRWAGPSRCCCCPGRSCLASRLLLPSTCFPPPLALVTQRRHAGSYAACSQRCKSSLRRRKCHPSSCCSPVRRGQRHISRRPRESAPISTSCRAPARHCGRFSHVQFLQCFTLLLIGFANFSTCPHQCLRLALGTVRHSRSRETLSGSKALPSNE
jgi:hypothetical protein